MPRKKRVDTSWQLTRQLAVTLALSSGISVLLYVVRAVASDSDRYWFLNWNLVLAWLPLLFAWLLKERLKTTLWFTWQNIGLTLLWLGFLPNSFYLVSDFIHLRSTGEVSLLYDVVLFVSFAWNGYVIGFSSLYIVHKELLKKLRDRNAHLIVGTVLLLCGYAIYLGRYLRWNTWDVLVNPAGLLFDVSDRFINPISNPQMFTTTAMFFVLLVSMYGFVWHASRILNSQPSKRRTAKLAKSK